MGLDIYFFKRQKKDYDPNDEGNGKKNDKDLKEVAYFRKVNFLIPFFDYQENCKYQKIARCEIEDLIEKCKETLELYDRFVKEYEKKQMYYLKNVQLISKQYEDEELKEFISKKTDEFPLKTTSGFFFGSTDYDEYFREDVESVLKYMKRILHYLGKNQEVYLYCWW